MRRIIALILVVALLISMTGCGTLNGEPASAGEMLFFIVVEGSRTIVFIAGTLVICGIAWVINEITTPLYEKTGWCVCQLAVDAAKGWKSLTDPNEIHGDWSDMDENQLTFHDEHLMMAMEKETVQGGADRFLSGGKEPEEKTSLFEKWFGCDHEDKSYDAEKIAVTCDCGEETLDDLSFGEFEDYVPRKKLLFWSKEDQHDHALREYRRYTAVNNGLDPDVMLFLLDLDVPELEEAEKQKLSDITGFLSGAASLVAESAGVDDGFAKGMDIPTEFFGQVNKYFGAANHVLVVLKAGADMANYQELSEIPGKETEAVHAAMEVLKGATSFIPVGSVVFSKVLDTVEVGINSIAGNLRKNLVGKTARDAEIYGWNFAKVKNYWFVENEDQWKDGPSLKDLAKGNLSAEELYGLAPYIEYRLETEVEEIYGITLTELIKSYEKSGK